MSKIALLLLFLIPFSCFGQVNYASEWFGPNALPVPDFTDATIPQNTTASLMSDYYFGFGDRTQNEYFKVEVPLLPKLISFKLWTTLLENYHVTEAVKEEREMEGPLAGGAYGDIYVQTRISIFKETKNIPAIILNSTLRTASGTAFHRRRYFNTPGYYFDVEAGKSFDLHNSVIRKIRVVTDLGFLCWETTNSTQDDAPLFEAKVILENRIFQLEGSFGGYSGWMRDGDQPLVWRIKLVKPTKIFDYFVQYQNGVNDFPYHQIRIGVNYRIASLTPKYKW